MEEIRNLFKERADLYTSICSDENFLKAIESASNIIRESIKLGGKIVVFGNGGSAAEAQHFSAELVGRFEKNRRAIPSIALTTDTSIITAQANDDSFNSIFSRQIEALVNSNDVVLGLTTSDYSVEDNHSLNILNGLKTARARGAKTIGLFSQKTKKLLEETDLSILVPNSSTATIQEAHLAVIHILCRFIEKDF